MATEHLREVIISQCIATVARYHQSGRALEKAERMAAEVQLIAGFVLELGLNANEIEETIIRPVEASLMSRYGHEVGPRHVNEFIKAFDGIKDVQDPNFQRTQPSL